MNHLTQFDLRIHSAVSIPDDDSVCGRAVENCLRNGLILWRDLKYRIAFKLRPGKLSRNRGRVCERLS